MMSSTPERDRIADRFEWHTLPDGRQIKTVRIHASWGPKAAEMTAEERAAVINRVLDEKGESIYGPARDE